MSVNLEDAWNFCYVLPQEPTNVDDVLLVVTNCLQMGWCKSPPFFCAVSETASRDIIMSLLQESSLPSHQFETQMLPSPEDRNPQTDLISLFACNAPSNRLSAAAIFINLTEVFADDFIGATNTNSSLDHLHNFSCAMLTGIHSFFPTLSITGHQGEDPIS